MKFDQEGYELVKDIIPISVCDFAYEYVKHWVVRQKILKDVTSPIEFGVPTDDFFGCVTDVQVPGSLVLRGTPFFDSLLVYLMPIFEKTLNRSLVPTYSFCRLYRMGDELIPHKDRKSCEVSVTLPIGWTNDMEDNWTIWVKDGNSKVGVNMQLGMGLMYKGCELLHWREKLLYRDHVQLFLHYNFHNML